LTACSSRRRFCCAIALGGFLLAAYFLFAYFAIGGTPAGFTSIAVLLLLLGGFIIASIGIVGLYVGKVFEQSKDRPLYVIDERSQHGIDEGVEPLTNAPPASRRFAEADRTSLARTGRRNKPVG
jgi:dolichol-phosphate mannosyltransferase